MVKKRDGAVAPKERINIVYRSTADNRRVKIELPMRMLVVSDLTKKPDDTPIEEREIINVDKRNLDEVMQNMDLNLNFSVPNKVSSQNKNSDAGTTESIDVQLNIKRMKDFSPDSICQNVPVLKKLLELRSSINALKGPIGNVPKFRRALEDLIHDADKRDRVTAALISKKDDE